MSTSGNTNSGYLSSPLPVFPASLAGATFQPPPPPREVQPAEPQPGFSIELGSSSFVNVQEPPPVAEVGVCLGSGGSNSGSRKRGRGPEAEDTIDIDSAPLTDLLPPPPPPPSSSTKRRRGRPRGSLTKNRSAPAPVPAPVQIKIPGVINARDLQMHQILLSPGEDLSGKLIAFAQHGNRNFFIASHYGAVSKATLRQPSSTGTRTYEGLYQLLSFAGSLIQSEAPDGKKAWTGGLTVSLLGFDSSVVAGSVAGPVIAASNMQVILCTFLLPKEEETEPATVDATNTTETNGHATGGDGAGMSNVDSSGVDLSESAARGGGGGGDVAGGGDGGGICCGERMSTLENMWAGMKDPGSVMEY